jgi:hypothetical protein
MFLRFDPHVEMCDEKKTFCTCMSDVNICSQNIGTKAKVYSFALVWRRICKLPIVRKKYFFNLSA